MIVVDASVVIESLLNTRLAAQVNSRLFAPGETLHAPHLVDVEVAQVVRRQVADGVIDSETGGLAMADLGDLRIVRHPHAPLLSRIWALRANLTAYDATYVALAEALGCPLLTRDQKLAAAPGISAPVELI